VSKSIEVCRWNGHTDTDVPNTLSAGVYQLRLNGKNIDIIGQVIKN
jgi:hypothetical protein